MQNSKMEEIGTELMGFFKVLADANRLKIIGLLAQGEYTSHTYKTGNYEITLTVFDDVGNSASETLL